MILLKSELTLFYTKSGEIVPIRVSWRDWEYECWGFIEGYEEIIENLKYVIRVVQDELRLAVFKIKDVDIDEDTFDLKTSKKNRLV